MKTMIGSIALALVALSGCGGNDDLSGDWFACRQVDCQVLDDDGVRFFDDNKYLELEGLNDSSVLAPNQTYCEQLGPTDSGTYSWDGMKITISPLEGAPRTGTLELDDDQFTLRTAEGTAQPFLRISPARSRGACP